MTHEEYLGQIETFTDGSENVAAVLAHAEACAVCRREERVAEKRLAELEPKRKSPIEEILRWSATAAILVLVFLGFHKETRSDAVSRPPASRARYVIVGNASGVMAYTPEGIVVGVPPGRAFRKGRS